MNATAQTPISNQTITIRFFAKMRHFCKTF